MGKKASIIVGERYNSLTIIKDIGVFNKNRKFLCQCDCGNVVEVIGNNLKKNNTTSCGCVAKQMQKEKWEKYSKERKSPKRSQVSPEYLAWRNMKSRCYNTSDISYPNYGAIGITVCEEWLNSFETFFTDVGKRPSKKHSLDRTNVNLGYFKDNISWKDSKWQARNKRKMNGTKSKFKGVSFENNKWRARIKNEYGISTHLGMFEDELTAAKAVDAFLKQTFGESCSWTNESLGLFDLKEG